MLDLQIDDALLSEEQLDALECLSPVTVRSQHVHGRGIWCPDCGTRLPVLRESGGYARTTMYGPCPTCRVWLEYDGEEGVYRVIPLPADRTDVPTVHRIR